MRLQEVESAGASKPFSRNYSSFFGVPRAPLNTASLMPANDGDRVRTITETDYGQRPLAERPSALFCHDAILRARGDNRHVVTGGEAGRDRAVLRTAGEHPQR